MCVMLVSGWMRIASLVPLEQCLARIGVEGRRTVMLAGYC
jgi:hypothetical protein